MNREQRRHPGKQSPPRPPQEQGLLERIPLDDDASARSKSHRHKKVTADKWNQ
jgi:hypothetical protein